MQIVVTLSEEDYNLLVNVNDDKLPSMNARLCLHEQLKTGIILPKGYGRLISTSDLDITKLVDSDIEWVMGRCDISRVQDMIDNAPTIIETDKGAIE